MCARAQLVTGVIVSGSLAGVNRCSPQQSATDLQRDRGEAQRSAADEGASFSGAAGGAQPTGAGAPHTRPGAA